MIYCILFADLLFSIFIKNVKNLYTNSNEKFVSISYQ